MTPPNPRDEIENRIVELGHRAHDEYLDGPLEMAIAELQSLEHELDEEQGRYLDGYRRAIYDLKSLYITYSGKYRCDCVHPFPGEKTDGSWFCMDCETELVGKDEVP